MGSMLKAFLVELRYNNSLRKNICASVSVRTETSRFFSWNSTVLGKIHKVCSLTPKCVADIFSKMDEVSLSLQGKLLPMITFKHPSKTLNFGNLDYATISLIVSQ